MQLAEQIIVVESSVVSAGEEVKHIKLTVGDTPGAIFYLSLEQARSLAKSMVEQVHRLEVANSMHKTKPQTRTAQIGRQGTMVLGAARTV